jgi:Ser/Thr protein kinase RdoA (MazF antagonist)
VSAPHPRLAAWWIDDPRNPGRATLDCPAVQRLATLAAPGSVLRDLGGSMSLNVHLEAADLVLRVHQPFVSRARLAAVQEVRCALVRQGLLVPVPVPLQGRTIVRCGDRLAEFERFLPHTRPTPILESYVWLFGALGHLHQALATLDLAVPRPVVATYAPPGTAARWLAVTQATIDGDGMATETIRRARAVLRRVRTRWMPAASLPRQLVHGDVRLSNICRTPSGETVFLDFGFLTVRPRVHDVANALAFMLLAFKQTSDPARADLAT